MKAHWQNEKDLIQAIRKIKETQEQLGVEAQQAEREGNLARVAEIRYGRMNELGRQLEKANQDLAALQENRKMLKEEVDDEDIAEVVAKWDRDPGEQDAGGRAREAAAHGRPAGGARHRPARGGDSGLQTPCGGRAAACRTPTGPSVPSYSWDPPGSAKPSWPKPWRLSSLTATRPWCASTCRNSWRSTPWPG